MQVQSGARSSNFSTADRLAADAKRAVQAKGKAVASSPSSSSHDAADFASLAQAEASPETAGAERGRSSSFSVETQHYFQEPRHCACCWRTRKSFPSSVQSLTTKLLLRLFCCNDNAVGNQ